MATPAVTVDTLVIVKIAIDGNNRKFKLPLRELNATILPQKLRTLLQIPDNQTLKLERFSDSAGSYITLDPNNPSAYKQLYRAAKAKLKLRLKASSSKNEPTVATEESSSSTAVTDTVSEAKLVTSSPLPEVLQPEPAKVKMEPVSTIQSESANLIYQLLDKSQSCGTITKSVETPAQSLPCWQVFCNNCDKVLSDAHFHCSICDKGDYDLCESCVDSGNLCHGDGHWLIKRFIKDGKVINSTTERVAPKPRAAAEKEPKVPGAFKSEIVVAETTPAPHRTCNNCVRVFPENVFFTCKDCEDFDLCTSCHVSDQHGHHPGHTLQAAIPGTEISDEAAARCAPGRNVRHFAICDGCDTSIIGIRHKCLDCPDWDYCNKCYDSARKNHPGHRFVPMYESLMTVRSSQTAHHHGILCDGPMCVGKADQSYIKGIRYKCAICHDTDFCANCEAHPSNSHNATHPMIKFKTAVRGVSIQTTGDDGLGQDLPNMGDKTSETTPAMNPTPSGNVMNLPIRTNTSETLPAHTVQESPAVSTATPAIFPGSTVPGATLYADFVSDMIKDGTNLAQNEMFFQTWVIRNPGPSAWPIGCRLVHTGGDDMLYIDRSKPVSILQLARARESRATTDVVQPGEERSFTVRLRTPAKEGKHISYWRLKTSGGLAFGHKLWCDVNVTATAAVVPLAASAAAMATEMTPPPGFEPASADQWTRLKQQKQTQQYLHQQVVARQVNAQRHRTMQASAAAGKAWSVPLNVAAAEPPTEAQTAIEKLVSHTSASSAAPLSVFGGSTHIPFATKNDSNSENGQHHRMFINQTPATMKQWTEQGHSNNLASQSAAILGKPGSEAVTRENIAVTEKNEVESLVADQSKRRQGVHQEMPEGSSRESVLRACLTADNLEMRALAERHRQRRQQLHVTQKSMMQAPTSMSGQGGPQPAAHANDLMHQQQRAWRQQRAMMQQALAGNGSGIPAAHSNAAESSTAPSRERLRQMLVERSMRDQNDLCHKKANNAQKPAVNIPQNPQAVASYEMQLAMLAMQNRKRLAAARAEFLLEYEAERERKQGTSGCVITPLQPHEQNTQQIGNKPSPLTEEQWLQSVVPPSNGEGPPTLKPTAVNNPPTTTAALGPDTISNLKAFLQKESENLRSLQTGSAGSPLDNASASKSATSSGINLPKPATVEDVDPITEEENLSGSQMVFPKLEKESPVSSTHLDSKPTTPAANVTAPISNMEASAPSVAAPPSMVDTETTAGDIEDFGDVETIEMSDAKSDVDADEESDDGFETDDYDILDASDEEVTGVYNAKTGL